MVAGAEPTAIDDPPARPLLMERMLFFSDAVFAIVLTLLALDLKLPPGTDDAHLLAGVAAVQHSLIAFALSFALVGVFWLAHAVTMRALARFDWVVAAVNLVFLFTITWTPFATTLVGRFGTLGEAWRFYCLTVVAISLTLVALIVVSHRDEPRIVHAVHHGRAGFRLARASTPGIAFAIGLALSLAGQRLLASYCWVIIPLMMIVWRWLPIERTAPAPSPAVAPDAASPGG